MIMAAHSTRKAAMLRAIRSAGAWIDRAEIASQTGKRELAPNDLRHLNDLEAEGYIQRRVVPGSGIREKFEYMATDKEGEIDQDTDQD